MRDLGEFESVFKRALRDQFEYERIEISKVLLVTDLEGQELDAYRVLVQDYLAAEFRPDTYSLRCLGNDAWSDWAGLRLVLEEEKPDLIITYRLLRVAHPEVLTSLGVYVDSLTQVTSYPVLLMPNPHFPASQYAPKGLGSVMVATEHLFTDHSLVNYGIRFTCKGKKLLYCHIEDVNTFEYYMKAIEKVPELDNDLARSRLQEQLTAMPQHYAESVGAKIVEYKKEIELLPVIRFGHIISTYRDLIAQEPISLLVFNTKDDTQLAMHSLGYSLAVEFRNLPILLL